MSICPHCGSLSSAEKHPSLRFRCSVCGGPIVPTDARTKRTNGELGSLVAAQRAHAMALGWIAAAIVLAVIAAIGAVLAALLFWHKALLAASVFAALAAAAVALSMAGRFAGRARRREVRRKLDDAWERVAEDVIASHGNTVTAADLAVAMDTDEPYAASLLARASSLGHAHARVREDAELTYEGDRSPGDTDAAAGDAGRAHKI